MPRMELDEETRAVILLNQVEGLGATAIAKLVEYHGRRADRVLKASDREMRETRLPSKAIAGILEARRKNDDPEDPHRGIDPKTATLLQEPTLGFVHFRDEDYPPLLREIYAPPAMLYTRGSLEGMGKKAVAIVGSRRAAAPALETAHRIAAELAEAGVVVVSGLADGVDAKAHAGALDGGGRTVAVMPCGLGGTVYPYRNRALAERIKKSGALVSELPLTAPVRRQNFDPRNRIISGMCCAALIVQAQMRSGSLITARHALNEGRTVFAVKWSHGALSEGSNMLIEEGAVPVESAGGILEHLERPAPTRRKIDLEQAARTLWDVLTDEPTYIDALKHATGFQDETILSALQLLEQREMARLHPGKRYTRLERSDPYETTARPKTETRRTPTERPAAETKRPATEKPAAETRRDPPTSGAGSAAPELEGAAAAVWNALTDEPTHIDALTQATGLPAQEVATALLTLEIKDMAKRHPGMCYSRARMRR